MRTRMAMFSALMALTFVIGVFAAAPASAAPQRASAPQTVTEMAKVILGETSVAAPGFYANANLGSRGVIAWAGIDPTHRLNVMTSTDGLHYSHKVTLNQTTESRPAVVQMSESAGGAIAVAWRGTDPTHRLNVLFDVYGTQKKLTLNETSFAGPALTVFQGKLFLAWAGDNPNHSLNVMPISIAPLAAGTKTTLHQFGSSVGPSLTVVDDGANSGVVIGWSTATSELNLAQSTNGVSFTTALSAGLPQTSAASPDLLHYHTEGGPEYWLAWTGTDPNHHLNVQWTTHYPLWPDPRTTKTVLPEWAFGGPTIGFEEGVVIAWTGTDPNHHLNVARLQGF